MALLYKSVTGLAAPIPWRYIMRHITLTPTNAPNTLLEMAVRLISAGGFLDTIGEVYRGDLSITPSAADPSKTLFQYSATIVAKDPSLTQAYYNTVFQDFTQNRVPFLQVSAGPHSCIFARLTLRRTMRCREMILAGATWHRRNPLQCLCASLVLLFIAVAVTEAPLHRPAQTGQ